VKPDSRPQHSPTAPTAPTSTTRTRVRYGETDQMGVVYHANYFAYFEIGRTDLIRTFGVSYAELETQGVRLPVVDVTARFLEPARYDDELAIETTLADASFVRLRFEYRVLRESDRRLLATGHTVLASVGVDGRPRRLPAALAAALGAGLRGREPSAPGAP